MKRLLTITVIASLLSIGAPMTAQAKPAIPCDGKRIRTIVPRLGADEVTFRVKLLIKCAVARFPVEGGPSEAICYSRRESSLWPWSVGGDSVGLFQPIASTWLSWWHSYPLVRRWAHRANPNVPVMEQRYVAYANAMLSVRVLHDTEQPWTGGRYTC